MNSVKINRGRSPAGFLLSRLAVSAAMLLSSLYATVQAQEKLSPDILMKIDSVLQPYHLPASPGAAVGVFHRGRIAVTRYFGLAQVENGMPVNSGTRFNVGSLAKQFTAFAIALLAQEGKLSLDDDIRKYLPAIPEFGDKITILHLVHHTSGLPDAFMALLLDGWRPGDIITKEDIVRMASRLGILNFQPGAEFLYNTGNYVLLTLIIEKASGMPFTEFTQKRIFQPLGMEHTFFSDDHSQIIPDRAHAYSRQSGAGLKISMSRSDFAGATGLYTTIDDLYKWDRNFYTARTGGSQALLLMQKKAVLNNGLEFPYAFGLSFENFLGRNAFGHSGGDAGYRSDYIHFPGDSLSVVILANADDFPAARLTRSIATIILGAKGGGVNAEGMPGDIVNQKWPEGIGGFAGVYWLNRKKALVEFSVNQDQLLLHIDGITVPLKRTGNRRFGIEGHPAIIEFRKQPAGILKQVRIAWQGDTGEKLVYQGVPPADSSLNALAKYEGIYHSGELQAIWAVSVQDSSLVIRRNKLDDIILKPAFRDAFTGDTEAGPVIIHFSANGTGKRFTVSTQRIRFIIFSEQ